MVDVSESESECAEPAGALQPDVVPGLYWGVRDSFVQYVLGNPDGGMHGDDGLETDGEGMFRFPVLTADHAGSTWRMSFAGDLRFTAHLGMLNVGLIRPVVELGVGVGTLSIEGPDGTRVTILELDAAEPVTIDDEWLVFPPIATRLTEHGVAVFGDVYPAGTSFDDVRIALPAGEATPVGAAG